jgi:HD superfamily phosphohydrolase
LREIDESAPTRVDRLIAGDGDIPHLARAVSGTFDVDRCDYLLRDSHMTGVQYGLLDLDWLLASLRLWSEAPGGRTLLAIDGRKGLTAVEGFFLARLHMYRQVYLHKAVRAAEVTLVALCRRLAELGPVPGTPPAFAAMLRGEEVSVADYLELDDSALDSALQNYAKSPDPVLADLASRIRERRLPKTMELREDADEIAARNRLHEILRTQGLDPNYLGVIDRVSVDAYLEDHALMVLDTDGSAMPLLEASPLLHGLSRERFVHHRALFPESARDQVRAQMREFI